MDFKWIIFAIILIANAIAAFAIAVILLRRPQKTGIRLMSQVLLGLGIWSFAYAMIALSHSLEEKHFWLKIENIGIVSVPVLWFFFSLRYTQIDGWMANKAAILLFWVIPATSILLLFSEQWFHLYYTSTHLAAETGGPLIISRGPMYWVQLVQSYILNMIAIGVLTWRFFTSRIMYRRQTPYLIGAVVIPFFINMIYQIAPGLLPIFSVPVDLTPLFFNITATLIVASIFGLRLFDLVPIARDSVMEHIPEMVFVVDANDQMVDANAIAQKQLGKSLHEIIGKDPIDVFHHWPQLLKRFFFTEYSREEIEIPGEPVHTLEITITPIYNKMNVLEGRVILARDVTERKRLENQLKSLNQSLREKLEENQKLQDQLKEQAIRDPLTGVFNRRFFAEALDKDFAQAVREGTPFSVIILDVDHFKQFNDTYGHKCGDIVLQALAGFLSNNTRRSDIVCRYGGEEFIILMPDATPGSSFERAEIFRQQFEQMEVEYAGRKLKCTFSPGVASFPAHSNSAEALLLFADHALYQSKSDGRNRVTVYSPTTI
ncbi:MAG TPA: diguanylate cyclase [Anaerolineales bacterium]|nr:diguanylate cyclase [Anaerolineales bacterium]HNN12740.1 diguanylate cyclase [Anaerolineales bacterium]